MQACPVDGMIVRMTLSITKQAGSPHILEEVYTLKSAGRKGSHPVSETCRCSARDTHEMIASFSQGLAHSHFSRSR
jgi:hypothetical protein